MSRRTIVVLGTTYKWALTAYGDVVVFPPKGGGGPRVIRPDPDPGPYDPFCDHLDPVTPGVVAELIHRHILGIPMPVREPAARRRAPPVRPEAVEPGWATSTEVPRSYVVLATLRAPGLPDATVAVEAHVDPGTARLAARSLDVIADEIRGHYSQLVSWDERGRSWKRPGFRRRRGFEEHVAMPGIEGWLDEALAAGARSLDEVSFAAVEVPLRVPVEVPRSHYARRSLFEREAANTLARLRLPERRPGV